MAARDPAFEPHELARRADRDDPLAAVAHRLAELDATFGDDIEAGVPIALREGAFAAPEHDARRHRDAGSTPRPRPPATHRGRAVRTVLLRGARGRTTVRSALHRAHDRCREEASE